MASACLVFMKNIFRICLKLKFLIHVYLIVLINESLWSSSYNDIQVGVGVKPGSSVDTVLEWVDSKLVDMVLIMTVEPGFGGQKFMADMMCKVKMLREKYPHLDIEVDGGVGPSTIDQCASAGANMIVSGT